MRPPWADDLGIGLGFAFAAAMLVSAALDIAWRRLPNWLNLAIALGYLPWAWAVGVAPAGVGLSLAVGLVVLGLGFALFAAGIIGGGDAKMAAAVSLWIGLSLDLLRFFLVMSLAGGMLAIGALAWQGASGRRLTRALPYGVAIAAAGLDHWLRHSQAACVLGLCN